jgi:hypothetical protein
MEDDVHLARNVEVLGDILLNEAVVRVALEMRDVLGIAGDEIVDADDAESFGEETVGEMPVTTAVFIWLRSYRTEEGVG